MAGYSFIFLKFLLDHSLPAHFVFLAFCHIFTIYLVSHQSWNSSRIRRYFKYIFRNCLIALLVYIIICLPFTYFALIAPNSNINKLIAQTRECAYRFKEKCAFPCVKRSTCPKLERACFALAMCLREPLFLLRIQGFLEELLAQTMRNRSLKTFMFLTGGFVAWGLVNGRYMTAQNVANIPVDDNAIAAEDTSMNDYLAEPDNPALVEAAVPHDAAVVNNDPAPVPNLGAVGIFAQPQQSVMVQGNPDIPFDPGNLPLVS